MTALTDEPDPKARMLSAGALAGAGLPTRVWAGQGPSLETHRLVLRPLRAQDAEPVSRFISDWDVARQGLSIAHPYTQARAVEWIGEAQAEWAQGRVYAFALARRSDARFLGVLSLRLLEPRLRGRADIGYWLGQPFWGRGYALEAIEAVKPFAHRRLRLRLLDASVYNDNLRSLRVLEKAGFRRVGTAGLTVRDGARRRSISLYRHSLGSQGAAR
ncbi:MAG: GNAT family N-acetyltransferase [Pseudomonadota bacterium]